LFFSESAQTKYYECVGSLSRVGLLNWEGRGEKEKQTKKTNETERNKKGKR
jgi:hypothetical protein